MNRTKTLLCLALVSSAARPLKLITSGSLSRGASPTVSSRLLRSTSERCMDRLISTSICWPSSVWIKPRAAKANCSCSRYSCTARSVVVPVAERGSDAAPSAVGWASSACSSNNSNILPSRDSTKSFIRRSWGETEVSPLVAGVCPAVMSLLTMGSLAEVPAGVPVAGARPTPTSTTVR